MASKTKLPQSLPLEEIMGTFQSIQSGVSHMSMIIQCQKALLSASAHFMNERSKKEMKNFIREFRELTKEKPGLTKIFDEVVEEFNNFVVS